MIGGGGRGGACGVSRVTAAPGAYALVGMGTAFAGIIRTPLTSVIMIFEVTRDYTIIVPVMVANLISYYISQRLQPDPFTRHWPSRTASTCLRASSALTRDCFG